jgi:hypothetical protein
MYNTVYNTMYNTKYNTKYNNEYNNKYKNNITCVEHVYEYMWRTLVNIVPADHLKVGSSSEAFG